MALTCDEVLPIGLESITVNSVCEFDLYQEVNGSYRLFRRQQVPIEQKDLNSLKEGGLVTLYVPSSQEQHLHKHMISNIPNILSDETIPVKAKLDILTRTSVGIMDKVLTDPMSESNISVTVDQCRNHVSLALQSNGAERSMVKSTKTPCLPIAHAINVGNLSILLGLRCGISDPDDLHGLGVGALFHEIGKRLLDRNYYFRHDDWMKITNTRLKKYPVIGKDMLDKSEAVPSSALRPVLEHQERLDGSGFPNMLKADEISVPGRIVAICDFYDESLHLSGAKAPPTPFQVLKRMNESVGKFDKEILIEFIQLLGTDLAE